MALTLATAAAQADTPVSLQPALKPLAGFLGSRHNSGSFLKSGKAIRSNETLTAKHSGHQLMLRHADQAPFSFDALERWGYDAQKKLFVAHLFDSFGCAREFSSPGLGWGPLRLYQPGHERAQAGPLRVRAAAGFGLSLHLCRDGGRQDLDGRGRPRLCHAARGFRPCMSL